MVAPQGTEQQEVGAPPALLDADDRPGAVERYRLIYAQARAQLQTMTFDES